MDWGITQKVMAHIVMSTYCKNVRSLKAVVSLHGAKGTIDTRGLKEAISLHWPLICRLPLPRPKPSVLSPMV
jgi:hypothetical protein